MMLNTGKKESGTGCETPGSSSGFVKSSAYAPVSLNLMGMYLVKEHMNAHYKRIYNVKAAVDTRPPHSIQNRMKSAGGASRCSSRQSYAKTPHFQHDGNDERSVNFNFIDKIDKYLESVRDYASSPSTSVKNCYRNSSAHRIRESSRNGQLQVKYGYTEAANRKYNTRNNYCNHEKRVVPALRIQRDLDHARWLKDQARKFRAEQRLNELERFDKLLEDFDDDNYDECDKDLPINDNDEADYEDFVTINSPMESVLSIRDRAMLAPINNPRIKSSNRYSSMRSLVKEQLEAEEEELRYLEFITDVTNDILLRGVYTDRALKQVFQYHMNRRNDLNFSKMKNLLGKLQDDLGIPRFEKQFASTFEGPNFKEKNTPPQNQTRNEPETVENGDSSREKTPGNKKTTVHFSPNLVKEEEEASESEPEMNENEWEFGQNDEKSSNSSQDGGNEPITEENPNQDGVNEAVIKENSKLELDADWELSQQLVGYTSNDSEEEKSEKESFEDDFEFDEKEEADSPSLGDYSDEDFCSSRSEN